MSDDERSASSALHVRGPLADVYVPALVAGSMEVLEALLKRLGERATVTDALGVTSSGAAALRAHAMRWAAYFRDRNGTYEPVCSTASLDEDVAEGRVRLIVNDRPTTVPIAVVAERKRLREIVLRIYFVAPGARPEAELHATPNASAESGKIFGLSAPIEDIVRSLRERITDEALAGFEESAHGIDEAGRRYDKRDGRLRSFLATFSEAPFEISNFIDDGRTACLEVMRGARERSTALLCFQRGSSGLVSELRKYGR